jgi:hypothetical protein
MYHILGADVTSQMSVKVLVILCYNNLSHSSLINRTLLNKPNSSGKGKDMEAHRVARG